MTWYDRGRHQLRHNQRRVLFTSSRLFNHLLIRILTSELHRRISWKGIDRTRDCDFGVQLLEIWV